MGTFDFCCGLLVPLYAARATEVVLYGREGATLSTAQEVCLVVLILIVCLPVILGI